MPTDFPRNREKQPNVSSLELERFEGLQSEQILLEGDELDFEPITQPPQRPQKHFHIVNRSHALETELILFEGGWLSVRQHRRRKPGEAQLVNLQFVDPQPEVSRYLAKGSLYVSVTLGVLGIAAAALAFSTLFLTFTLPATILFLFASGVSFAACAYRTQKHATFYTRVGRAPVFTLMATLGSFRLLREALPDVIAAIRSVETDSTDSLQRLRDEMREHYRMRESGIIDESTCAASTQRILSQFK